MTDAAICVREKWDDYKDMVKSNPRALSWHAVRDKIVRNSAYVRLATKTEPRDPCDVLLALAGSITHAGCRKRRRRQFLHTS